MRDRNWPGPKRTWPPHRPARSAALLRVVGVRHGELFGGDAVEEEVGELAACVDALFGVFASPHGRVVAPVAILSSRISGRCLRQAAGNNQAFCKMVRNFLTTASGKS